ncbi:Ubiquitin-like protein 3 [Polyplax serrata]|uniref:Ubiquitin-like protein 3 n=1 Tax=Polyplax serrata TaxID=468196 RepID=A0AAN8NY15_POLSC
MQVGTGGHWCDVRHARQPCYWINLRLILVSGKTKEFLFSPNESAGEIAQHVFDSWPEDWAEEAVSKAEILRLIYQGRFLHSNVTLGALGLPFGKTTVMHLVPRENLPEPNSHGWEPVCPPTSSSPPPPAPIPETFNFWAIRTIK